MTDITKLRGVFAVFSCIGFRLAFIGKRGAPTERYPMGEPIDELYTTGAYHGAPEAWDDFGRAPNTVFGDIERRGEQWHVDVITHAYRGGRYDCLFASVYFSLDAAYRALTWLSTDNWKVLKEAPRAPNGSSKLSDIQATELALYAEEFEPEQQPDDEEAVFVIHGRNIDGAGYYSGHGWANYLGEARSYFTKAEADEVKRRLIKENEHRDFESVVGQIEVIGSTVTRIETSYSNAMKAAEEYEAAHPEEFTDLSEGGR